MERDPRPRGVIIRRRVLRPRGRALAMDMGIAAAGTGLALRRASERFTRRLRRHRFTRRRRAVGCTSVGAAEEPLTSAVAVAVTAASRQGGQGSGLVGAWGGCGP